MGTPRAITRPSDNAVVWKWENSDPFGANSPNEDPASTGTAFKYNLRFPGQYADQETGTFYNYFRDYDPSTGRFIESDPIGLKGGINTFAYVENDPLRKDDPFGLAPVGVLPPDPSKPAIFYNWPRKPAPGPCDPRVSCYAKCIAENAMACQPLAWGLGLATGTLVGATTAFFCPVAAPFTFGAVMSATALPVNMACQNYLIEKRCNVKCKKPESCEKPNE